MSFGMNPNDDGMFEFLHMELVAMLLESEPGQVSNPSKAVVSHDIERKDTGDAETTIQSITLSSMEYIGFSTGYRMVERLTKDWPRFKDELDTMKFICKEFWTSVFRKQVDNLRTNKQGVYVLQDNCFRFLAKISQSQQYIELSPKFAVYTCGLIRGSLANLGMTCAVTAEVTSPPACRFQVQIHRS